MQNFDITPSTWIGKKGGFLLSTLFFLIIITRAANEPALSFSHYCVYSNAWDWAGGGGEEKFHCCALLLSSLALRSFIFPTQENRMDE